MTLLLRLVKNSLFPQGLGFWNDHFAGVSDLIDKERGGFTVRRNFQELWVKDHGIFFEWILFDNLCGLFVGVWT